MNNESGISRIVLIIIVLIMVMCVFIVINETEDFEKVENQVAGTIESEFEEIEVINDVVEEIDIQDRLESPTISSPVTNSEVSTHN